MPVAGISKVRKSAEECNRMDQLFQQLENAKKKPGAYAKDSADKEAPKSR